MARSLSLLFLLLFAAGIYQCSGHKNTALITREAQALEQKGKRFHCEFQDLGKQSRQLWDSVAYSLQQQLPQDMPPEERNNIIEIRNASLIRMFEAFPKLPSEVQQTVNRAEEKDQVIADRMRALNDSIRQHDMAVAHFLKTAAVELPDSLTDWRQRLALYDCE